MARRDGLRPQLDFPELIADVISELRVRGPLGVLNLTDEVRPVYIIGAREGSLEVTSVPVTFGSAAVFHGAVATPAANAVIVTTGALPAGDYDILAHIAAVALGTAVSAAPVLQHRNAADAATLATLLSVGVSAGAASVGPSAAMLPLIGYTLAINERLRVVNSADAVSSGVVTATIFAQRRIVP